jgi:beta-glucosidase
VIDLARALGPENQKARDFIWAAGIEDTFVPQVRPGHKPLDEYELIGHYENWRVDLDLCRDIGVRALRWGIPWYKVEPERGSFDWQWTDDALAYMVEELKITPILDLMHYGCPFWLERGFANRDYPKRVAEFAAAVAERYKHLVKCYTPLNEPIITALMCGMRGLWPPYLRGEKGYLKLMLQIAKGIIRTVKAIKAVDPTSVMFHVEATGLTRTIREDLASLAREEQHRGYICYDLITGNLSHDHLLFSWLLRSGTPLKDLLELQEDPIKLDVVGMNFYPQWSTKQIYLDKSGQIAFREAEPEGGGFAELIRHYHERYQAPIMITETSAVGSDDIRLRWLKSSVASIKTLRADGVPVIGYTWFPLFTMVDWRYRFANEPVENFYLELGLYALNREAPKPRWLETPLVKEFQKYVDAPEKAIGDLKALNTSAHS